jgi:hypothetical protein
MAASETGAAVAAAPRRESRAKPANGEATPAAADQTNANGVRRVLDRLAALAVPGLLGALGVVLWSVAGDLVAGVAANRDAIADLRAAVETLTVTVNERTADLWTGAQEEQRQMMQALIDTAQNEELIEAKAELRAHRERLEAMAIELAVDARRLDEIEAAQGEGESE